MKSSEPQVLFVGALTLDTLYRVDDFSRGPSKYLASDVVTKASGTAATAAARLGGRIALWASVGDDAIAPTLISDISSEGVDCTHVRHVGDGRSASATIVVDSTGEPWVVVAYDSDTQAPPEVASIPPIEQFAAVMADARWPGAARLALIAAREAGRYAIFDADVASSAVLSDIRIHSAYGSSFSRQRCNA